MLGLNLARRTRRGMAVGALMLAFSVTTFGGTASAMPQTDDSNKSCAALAAARNDAVHTLHDAWKGFREDLKDLAQTVREVDKDARHSAAAVEMTKDARKEIAEAREKLDDIWTTAHGKIQDMAELGQACADKDEDQAKDENTTKDQDEDKNTENDKDEDSSTKTSTTNTTTATHTLTGADLAAQLKPVVDQAIKDMKAVVDDVTAAVAKMTEAAQSANPADAATVKADRDHEKSQHGKPSGRNGRG